MSDWRMWLALILTVIAVLVGAVACVRNGGATSPDDMTVRDALRESVAFCAAHDSKLPADVLQRARRAFEKHDWIEAARATLDALRLLQEHYDLTLPERVIAAEAILRSLFNGIDSGE